MPVTGIVTGMGADIERSPEKPHILPDAPSCVRFTTTLHPAPPRFPLDVHPLARLHADGRLELLQAAFPPFGRIVLTLWRPGEDPAFRAVVGTVVRGWRWEGPAEDAWVVCWLAVGDPTQPI